MIFLFCSQRNLYREYKFIPHFLGPEEGKGKKEKNMKSLAPQMESSKGKNSSFYNFSMPALLSHEQYQYLLEYEDTEPSESSEPQKRRKVNETQESSNTSQEVKIYDNHGFQQNSWFRSAMSYFQSFLFSSDDEKRPLDSGSQERTENKVEPQVVEVSSNSLCDNLVSIQRRKRKRKSHSSSDSSALITKEEKYRFKVCFLPFLLFNGIF
jgi:hypothetical protein